MGVTRKSKQSRLAACGTSLRPLLPSPSKQMDVRYLDIHEDDRLDEGQFAAWVKQASKLPSEKM